MKGGRAVIIFAGTYFNFKLDSKGRLSVPTKWRERLGRDFYMVAVTVKGCKCITLYPTSEFEKVYEKHSTAQKIRCMTLQKNCSAKQRSALWILRADLL